MKTFRLFLNDFLTSKKVWAMFSAIITALGGYCTDTIDGKETVAGIMAAIMVYLGAQGIADNGKSAAIVEHHSNLQLEEVRHFHHQQTMKACFVQDEPEKPVKIS